jgi:uncharacterized RDD family membrane protein YckC
MGARFLNVIIDLVTRALLAFPVLSLLRAVDWQPTNALQRYLVTLLFMVSYYLVMEGILGFTVGKLITGTRVVNEEGRSAGFGQILGRTFSRLVPFDALSFFGTPSIGWHDRWSGTRVIKVRR